MDLQITKRLDILTEGLQRVQNNQDDTKNQLDQDRANNDRLRVDMVSIRAQQDVILKNLADFKDQIRQTIQDTVSQEVSKAVKKELEKIEMANPKKVFIVKGQGIISFIRSLFKKNGK